MGFEPGDIVRRKGDDPAALRYRYRVTWCGGGIIAAHRIRKDGERDYREHAFSASAERFELAEIG